MAGQAFVIIDDTTQSMGEVKATQVGGAGAENLIPSLDSAGRLATSMMPVGVAPEVKVGNAFEAIAANALVYIKSDGTVANATAAVSGHYAKGWSQSAVSIGNPVTVQFEGTMTGLSGLTIDATYFLSSTVAGGITATAPTASGTLWQEIGVAISATELNFTNAGTKIKRA
jgi:hypothetical protein